MFDRERWNDLVAGNGCPLCNVDDDALLLTEMPSGRVLLTDDADFPGYCILVHRRHVTELFQLDEEERRQMMEDVTRIARAVANRCSPAKLNYAILGNEVPHLHCHVIPRYADDGYWGKPIWSRPADQRNALAPEQYEDLRQALRKELDRDL